MKGKRVRFRRWISPYEVQEGTIIQVDVDPDKRKSAKYWIRVDAPANPREEVVFRYHPNETAKDMHGNPLGPTIEDVLEFI